MFKDIVLLIILLMVAAITILVVTKVVTKEMDMYYAENQCVARHIAVGIERRDIHTKDGVCWVD